MSANSCCKSRPERVEKKQKIENRRVPRADLAEHAEHFLLSMDMPGVLKEDLQVTLEEDTLKISGVRETGAATVQYERNFQLNHAVNADGIEAELQNGVLKLVLPKPESVKPLQIEIKQV